jgi:hypothetical protein
MMSWDDANASFLCPVFDALSDACSEAHSFARAMRRLRRSMRHCPQCEQYENCPVMQQFRLSIQAVLEEITREWELKV